MEIYLVMGMGGSYYDSFQIWDAYLDEGKALDHVSRLNEVAKLSSQYSNAPLEQFKISERHGFGQMALSGYEFEMWALEVKE